VSIDFSSRSRHTGCYRDWSSDGCASDLAEATKQVTILSMLATNPGLAQLAINASGLTREGLLKAGALQQAREELALMQENLKFQIGRASCRKRERHIEAPSQPKEVNEQH